MPTASESLGELFVRIKADLAELKQGLKKAEQTSANTAKTMETKFSGAFKKIGGLFLGLGLGRILLSWGKAAIRTAADFQTLRVRLTALYGDARKGGQAFKEFVQIAATTPFSVKQVVEAGATLKAFGTAATETIKPVADLAAFMGVDIVTAAQAMGRAFAGGAGAADVLRERGVLQLIKDFKGIDDLTKLTLPQFRKAMIESISDPAAGIAGSTNLLAQTFDGAMSNMMDAVDRFAAGIGSTFIPAFTSAAKSVGGFLSAMIETRTAVEDEAIEMNNAATAIYSYTGAQEGRVKLIRDMQALYPNFLKNLNAETVSNDDLKKAMQKANTEFENRIRLQLVSQDIAALEEEYTAAVREQREAQKGLTTATRDAGIANRFTGKTFEEIAASLTVLAKAGERPLFEGAKIVGVQYSAEAKVFQEAVDLFNAANRNLIAVQAERNARLAELNAEFSQLTSQIVGITTKASVDLAKPGEVAKDIAAPKIEPLAITTPEQIYPTPEEAAEAAMASTEAFDAELAEAQRLRDQREKGMVREKWLALGNAAAGAFISSGISQVWGKLTEGIRKEANLAVSIVIGMVDAMIAELTRLAALKILALIGLAQHGGSVGKGQHGGTFQPGAGQVKKAATGGSFDIPYGYQNDRFPLFVETGERVDVTSRGRVSSQDALLQNIDESVQVLNENIIAASQGGRRRGRGPQDEIPIRVTGDIKGRDIKLAYDKSNTFLERFR